LPLTQSQTDRASGQAIDGRRSSTALVRTTLNVPSLSSPLVEAIHHDTVTKTGNVKLAHSRVRFSSAFEVAPLGGSPITAVASFHG
jgi:hypothetical protein